MSSAKFCERTFQQSFKVERLQITFGAVLRCTTKLFFIIIDSIYPRIFRSVKVAHGDAPNCASSGFND